MNELVPRTLQGLADRWAGPLSFRLIVQPAIASLIGIRAGINDARHHRPAYFWGAITNPTDRIDLLKKGWKDIGRIFIIALVVDAIYQIIVLKTVYFVDVF